MLCGLLTKYKVTPVLQCLPKKASIVFSAASESVVLLSVVPQLGGNTDSNDTWW